VRNPGLTRETYERLFAEWLGMRRTIWRGEGCVGDDTHGHVDDVARFVSPDTIVLAVEADPADDNHERSIEICSGSRRPAPTPRSDRCAS
jgi:agmatine deiminase